MVFRTAGLQARLIAQLQLRIFVDHTAHERHWSGALPAKMTDEEIARINAEHLISTPLKPADLLFVFGQRRGEKEIIAAAIDLWQRGFFRHAIVSGGPTQGNPGTNVDELLSRPCPAALEALQLARQPAFGYVIPQHLRPLDQDDRAARHDAG